MKKLIMVLAGLMAVAGFVYADTVTPNTESGSIGIEIGSVWEIEVDGYSIDVNPDGDTDINNDVDVWTARGENMYFGTVNMLPAGIFSTLTSTSDTINEYSDVPHRAGSEYMDIRVYVNNNEDAITVDLTVTSPLVDQTVIVPPADNGYGGAAESTMHVVTGEMTAAMNGGATTSYIANLLYFTSDATPIAAADKGKIRSGVPITLYDSGADVVSDAFVAWVAVDFLPLTVPRTPGGSWTSWNDGSVVWTLVDKNP